MLVHVLVPRRPPPFSLGGEGEHEHHDEDGQQGQQEESTDDLSLLGLSFPTGFSVDKIAAKPLTRPVIRRHTINPENPL